MTLTSATSACDVVRPLELWIYWCAVERTESTTFSIVLPAPLISSGGDMLKMSLSERV